MKEDDTEAVKWFRKAAEQGLARAQCFLGLHYKEGIGVWKDEKEAFKWYTKAAEQGDAVAQCEIGWFFSVGTGGVEKDWQKAANWFQKAAEQEYSNAQYHLGMCYLNGNGMQKDREEAIKWLRKAAEQGHKMAKEELDEMAKSDNRDINAREVNAKKLDAMEALLRVEKAMTLCEEGERLLSSRNYADAVKCFRQAVALEYGDAQYHLGMCYLHGLGVQEDREEATKWLRKAASHGHKKAKDALDEMAKADSRRSKAKELDDKEILLRYKKAITLCEKGVDYLNKRCFDEAAKCFRQATAQGYDEAQYYLGICFLQGMGVPRDRREAVKWLREAAEQGHEKALKKLKDMGEDK